jgi:hypothetical protein
MEGTTMSSYYPDSWSAADECAAGICEGDEDCPRCGPEYEDDPDAACDHMRELDWKEHQ